MIPSPTPTGTPTATPTATLTPVVTNTPTRTPTIRPTPYPRPAGGVQVAPSGDTLQTTITARDAGCNNDTQNSQLLSLQFTRFTNATIDVPSVGNVASPTTVPLPSHRLTSC